MPLLFPLLGSANLTAARAVGSQPGMLVHTLHRPNTAMSHGDSLPSTYGICAIREVAGNTKPVQHHRIGCVQVSTSSSQQLDRAHQVGLDALAAIMVQIQGPAVHKAFRQDARSYQRLLCQLLLKARARLTGHHCTSKCHPLLPFVRMHRSP